MTVTEQLQKRYPNHIIDAVRQNLGLEKGDTSMDAEILDMERKEIFSRVVVWNGLLGGYHITIKSWIEDVYGINVDDAYYAYVKDDDAQIPPEKEAYVKPVKKTNTAEDRLKEIKKTLKVYGITGRFMIKKDRFGYKLHYDTPTLNNKNAINKILAKYADNIGSHVVQAGSYGYWVSFTLKE